MTTRPHRRRLDDRQMHAGKTKGQTACDMALAPFDEAAWSFENKWGIGRLEELVTPDMAARYGKAVEHLHACIADDNPDTTAAAAANCIRGLHAMDAAATAAGHKPAPGDIWIAEADGMKFAVMRDIRLHPIAAEMYPGLRLYSLREGALALQNYGQSVATVKDAFPGAEITAIRKSDWAEKLNDDIPF